MSGGGLGHLAIVGATAASAVVCVVGEKWAHRHYLAEDSPKVVLDEVDGLALTLAIVGPGLWTIITAFFAFRFFDILKPGIHWIESRGWPGIIVWDDLLAGLYAGGAATLGSMVLTVV